MKQIELIVRLFASLASENYDVSIAPLAMRYVYDRNSKAKMYRASLDEVKRKSAINISLHRYEIIEIHGFYSLENVVSLLKTTYRNKFNGWNLLATPDEYDENYADKLFFWKVANY
jgi:hypothetical protein